MKLSDLVGLVTGLKASVAWAGKIEELPPEVQFRAFLLLRKLEVGAKKRKEAVRDALLPFVEKNGTTDERGSQHFQFAEGKASRTRKEAPTPSVAKIVELLKTHGLNASAIVQEKVSTSLVVDVSKLDQLVTLGQLTKEEVASCYDVSHAFNASENKEAKVLLEGLG